MRLRLRSIRWEAEDINSYVLQALPGAVLPSFEPGAHIDVQLAPGLARSYSLVSDPAERGHYEIAVHQAPVGRGGSKHIHENWRVGTILEVTEPRNNFPLVEDAARTVMIAGGIGVTPMLPMIARLEQLGRSVELHYVAATPERAAYVDRLSSLGFTRISYDGIPGGQRLDVKAICDAAPADAHLYCCGPAGMLRRSSRRHRTDRRAMLTSNISRPKPRPPFLAATRFSLPEAAGQ